MRKFFLVAYVLIAVSVSAHVGVWDFDYMKSLRESSDPAMVDARKAIARAADKVLEEEPATVLEQKSVAPSGNKHDYYSMARYWWPNPKTENHLPYIRKDGQNNPETEGLGREALSHFQKQIEILALAYFYTQEEAYADKCWDCLRAWYINKKSYMTPHMEYSQVVLGRDDNHGRHEGLLDTYSMLNVPDILAILASSKATKQADVEAIRAWFSEYVTWMTTAKQAIDEDNYRNNHGTAFHVQLIVYAAFAGNDSLANQYIQSFTERRILPQVKPNGAQPEELARTRGFGYSCFNLRHLLDYVDICYQTGYPVLEKDTVARQRIMAAIDFLTPYLGRPVSAWPFQQINEWDKQQQELCWILRRADKYFPEKGYMGLFEKYNTAKPSNRRWLY